MAFDDEIPQHSLYLPAYRISQFPVTNAQYQEFVTAGSYGEKRYWGEADMEGYWSPAGFKGQ